jgi:hypothetical protein
VLFVSFVVAVFLWACCQRLEWRTTRTTGWRKLMRLGVSRRQGIRHGKSRKGYWDMATAITSGVDLTNARLAEQGLLSLKTLRFAIVPLRRTA